MEPQEYDKIVDRLIQFRGKLPLDMHITDKLSKDRAYLLRLTLDLLVERIDSFAAADSRGWIK